MGSTMARKHMPPTLTEEIIARDIQKRMWWFAALHVTMEREHDTPLKNGSA